MNFKNLKSILHSAIEMRRRLRLLCGILLLGFKAFSFPVLVGAALLEIEVPKQLERSNPLPFPPGSVQVLSSGNLALIPPDSDYPTAYILTPDFETIGAYQSRNAGRVDQASNGDLLILGDTNHCVWRVRLNGVRDESFVSPPASEVGVGVILWIQALSDGKALISHPPDDMGDPPYNLPDKNGLFRLNQDGSLDESFQIESQVLLGSRPILLPDGRIVIRAERFLQDGRRDPTWNLVTTDGPVFTSAVGPDGKVVISGEFNFVNGHPRLRIARLNSDGSLDPSFVAIPALDYSAGDLRIQPDGSVVFWLLTGLVSREWVIWRYLRNGLLDRNSSFTFPSGINDAFGFDLDSTGRIFVSRPSVIERYSGEYRVISDSDSGPIALQRSPAIDVGWSTITNVPPNTRIDYAIPDALDTDKAFFRVVPGQ